jgi:hypothetical protein
MSRILVVAGTAVAVTGLAVIAQPERGPGRGATPEQFVERMMEADANADGKLTSDELPEGFGARMLERGDTNGDGALDRAELLAMRSRAQGEQPEAGGQPASFHECMEQAGRAARGLRGATFGDGQRQNNLETVQGIQQALLAAKSKIDEIEMSPNAKAKFGSDQEAYAIAFRKQIVAALSESLVLENAILDGDAKAAMASAAKLIEERNAGHDLFQDEDH